MRDLQALSFRIVTDRLPLLLYETTPMYHGMAFHEPSDAVGLFGDTTAQIL